MNWQFPTIREPCDLQQTVSLKNSHDRCMKQLHESWGILKRVSYSIINWQKTRKELNFGSSKFLSLSKFVINSKIIFHVSLLFDISPEGCCITDSKMSGIFLLFPHVWFFLLPDVNSLSSFQPIFVCANFLWYLTR